MGVTPYVFREAVPSELETVINATLSTLLSQRILGVEVDAVQIYPPYAKNMAVAITSDTAGAATLTNPYVFKTFAAAEDSSARRLALNFMVANPTYFYSPIFLVYRPAVTDPNQSTVVAVIYNISSSDGAANWGYNSGGGSVPTGPAGGDLDGTYPNPEVIQGRITATGTVTQRTLTDRFADVLTIMDFGAVGDGNSHPLTADEAAAYNTQFASVGAQGANAFVAGDERDFAAVQSMIWVSGVTGKEMYNQVGTYRINRPVIERWSATPIPGQPAVPLMCRFSGAGRGTVFKGYGIAAGRGVFEFLGESNGYAVNLEFAHIQIEQDASCSKYSFCIRAGDGYCGIHLYRVICKGAQALALRVGSSFSYAQICFLATQCQFWSNWANLWGPDAGLDVYSVSPESAGSYWDSVLFEACFFWGQVDTRAFSLKFLLCIFVTPPMRALPFGSVVYLGTATYDTCYFEDSLISIATLSNNAPITNISIYDCHFSSNNNLTPPATVQSSIQSARGTYEHGPVTILRCRFGGTASVADIDLYGPISATVMDCCHPFGTINVAPTIDVHGDVRLITRNPNGEEDHDIMSLSQVWLEAPTLVGPVLITEENVFGTETTIENSDTGTSSYAALNVKAGTTVLKMISYSQNHAVLPGWTLLGPSGLGTFALTYNNLPKLYISDEPSYLNYAKIGGICYGQTANKAIANSDVITSIFSSGSGTPAVPANFLRAGRKLVIEFGGFVSSTGAPTLDFYLYFGAVPLISLTGMAASALSNAGFYGRVEVTIRTIGATGTVIAVGEVTIANATYPTVMTAVAVVDTTGIIVVDPSLKWSAADVLNTLTVTAYSIRAE